MQLGTAALRDSPRTRRTAALLVGDLLAIVAVLTAGLLRHGVDPVAMPGHAALVIGPFVVGWLVAAPLLGAYARPTLASAGPTVGVAVLAWGPAALVGVVARATPAVPGSTPPVFVAVVAGFGALGVGAWRTVVAGWLARSGAGDPAGGAVE